MHLACCAHGARGGKPPASRPRQVSAGEHGEALQVLGEAINQIGDEPVVSEPGGVVAKPHAVFQ